MSVPLAGRDRRGRGPRALHEHPSRILGAGVQARGARSDRELARRSVDAPIQVDGGIGEETAAAVREAGASLLVAGNAVFAAADPVAAYLRLAHCRSGMERALALADAAAGQGYPNPTVGAVLVSAAGEVVGEGVSEPAGGRHAEIVALDQAGERARGATLYVTLEPCAHHGRTPPCVDRIVAEGVGRVVAASGDPSEAAGGGAARLRDAGVEVELGDVERARRQNEAWRTWAALGRPHVVLKLAVSLDGRVVVPGGVGSRVRRPAAGSTSSERRWTPSRWAWGRSAPTRRGSTRATSRVVRRPRRLAFGRGPLPADSELELRTGALADELCALAADGVQSLLLEGGPTLATSFLAAGLVDRLLVFVAPVVAGGGPAMLGELAAPVELGPLEAERLDDDVLLDARLRAA